MTDTSIFRIDNMPISETPIEIKGLKNVKISVEPLAATKPFVHKWYFDFEESRRQAVEKIKPGAPVTLTMEWMNICDKLFIVDRVEGLRVYLKKDK